MQKRLVRIIIGGAIFIAALILNPTNSMLRLGIYLIAYAVVGIDVLWNAIRNIVRGKVFDENFLMSIATIGAFFIGEYPEGVAVMLFYQVGELFQDYAVGKSRRSISELMDIRPDYANVKRGDEIVTLDPEEVSAGDSIVVKMGEKIPLDGIVLQGNSTLDASALTGESLPREVSEGSEVLSGCINLSGLLTIEVTKEFGESTVNKILDLVENAIEKKSKSENFITKFAIYYTPIVVVVAAMLAFIPPMILGGHVFEDWLYRALIFLVISCPCALVISVPLSFFGGIGGASRQGILVKGGNYLEALSHTEIVVFDKTGTLTKGTFSVQDLRPVNITQEKLLEYAAYAESFSNHPISHSLKKAYGKDIDSTKITDAEEIAGHGVRAVVDGVNVYAGNAKLMENIGISEVQSDLIGTVVHVAVEGVYAGYILIADEIKKDAKEAIQRLRAEGVKKMVMLTGDTKDVASKVAGELGLDEVHWELLPTDKVTKLEELLKKKSPKGKLAYVGDGINDAPVLARADIGIAMGGLGSDAAIEAADVVVMTDEPAKVATGVRISRRTLNIVKQNVIFSLGVKGVVLVLAAVGIATMWSGVFADVGVTVIAVLNAMRALKQGGS